MTTTRKATNTLLGARRRTSRWTDAQWRRAISAMASRPDLTDFQRRALARGGKGARGVVLDDIAQRPDAPTPAALFAALDVHGGVGGGAPGVAGGGVA